MLRTNSILADRYSIVRQIGEGGMGAVYLAKDNRLGTYVALKQTFYSDVQMLRAFEREARLLARLRHTALPKVIDYFNEGKAQFLVMEFIGGSDLHQMIAERGGPFKIRAVLNWADQLLDALQYLHSRESPVLHRDIKPANMKLISGNQIILLDFGLAKGTVGQMTSVVTNRSVLGYTPHFAPLEQIQGTGTDARSDLYALGATLYYLLTAEPPTDAITRATAIVSDLPDPLEPPAPLPNDGVNAPLAEDITLFIMRALSLSPTKRPSSATEMREDLRKIRAVHAERVRTAEEQAKEPPQTVRATAPDRRDPRQRMIQALLEERRVKEPSPAAHIPPRSPSEETPQPTLKVPPPNVYNPPPPKVQPNARPAFVADASGTVRDLRVPPRRFPTRPPRSPRTISNEMLDVWEFLTPLFANKLRVAVIVATVILAGVGFLLFNRPTLPFVIKELRGHASAVNALAVSPDGSTIASGSDDQTVRLWDVATGSARVLTAHKGPVVGVYFSSDGTSLKSFDAQNSKYWDLKTGSEISKPGNKVFTPGPEISGKILIYSGDSKIVLMDIFSRTDLVAVEVENERVKSVAVSPNLKFAVSGGSTGSVKVWDISGYARY